MAEKFSTCNTQAEKFSTFPGASTPSGSNTVVGLQGGDNVQYTISQLAGAAPVQSVAGRTGTVTLSNTDISGLGNAAVKAVTDNTQTNVASAKGSFTSGHILTAADTAGTVQDGGATSQFLVAANNFNDVPDQALAGFNLQSGRTLQLIANKQQTLTAGTWTTVAQYSGGPGIIRKLWLAIGSVNPANCYINIVFDNQFSSPQFGTTTTSGFNLGNSLACDVTFTAGFAAASYWAAPSCGCNILSTSSDELGGYIGIDMPFNTAFTVQVFNNNGSNGLFWCQVFYDALPFGTTIPWKLWCQPIYFPSASCTSTTFTECPLVSVSSSNGVLFKGVKALMASGGGGGWQEGKFRFYTGGPGMSSTHVYTAASPSNLSYYNQQSGVTQIGQSSGTEDFFLSSYNFANLNYATEEAGVVLNSGGVTGNLTAYRYFKGSTFGAPPSTQFVATWTCGDQGNPQAATMTFFAGYAMWYS